MNPTRRKLGVSVLWFPLALFIGCGETEVARRPAPSKVKAPAAAAPARTVSVAPSAKPEESRDVYYYNPVGKRDPFGQYAGEIVETVEHARSPLELYDLNQLRVTAIIWGISSPRALVFAPDNQNYIVRENMRIGKTRGRISRITREMVYVEEESREPSGRLVVRESTLKLRTDKEDKTELKFSDNE